MDVDVAASFTELLRRMDEQRNGHIRPPSFFKMFAAIGFTLTSAQEDTIFKAIDTDGSGEIDSAEFFTFLTNVCVLARFSPVRAAAACIACEGRRQTTLPRPPRRRNAPGSRLWEATLGRNAQNHVFAFLQTPGQKVAGQESGGGHRGGRPAQLHDACGLDAA